MAGGGSLAFPRCVGRERSLPVPLPLTCSDPAAVSELVRSQHQSPGREGMARGMSHQCLALPELLHFKLGSSRLPLRGPASGREGRPHRILLLPGAAWGQPWDGPALREPGRGSRAPPRLKSAAIRAWRDRNFPFGHFCNCWRGRQLSRA